MKVDYSSKQLQLECTDEREMKRKRGPLAPKLRLRINALEAATSMADLQLLDPLGRWHQLTGDLAGCWAGKLSANWRLLVEESDPFADEAAVMVIEIDDYH